MSDGEAPSAAALDTIDRIAGEALARRRPVCLDSSALIAYLGGPSRVRELAARLIEQPGLVLVISTITVAEAVTRPATQGDQRHVAALRAALRSLPNLAIVPFDEPHAVETAFVRAETGLKLPDAAVVATARLAGAAALLGNDRQWRAKPLGVRYHHIDDLLALP